MKIVGHNPNLQQQLPFIYDEWNLQIIYESFNITNDTLSRYDSRQQTTVLSFARIKNAAITT